ncbi:MAG: FAD-dependent oxidoreductase, partial [Bacteroidota bacterium]
LPLDVDGAFVHDSPLSWVARNTSKPGRPEPETWVLHASPEWSTAHLEEEKDAVAPQLLEAFFEAAGIAPVEPAFATAHRWRYAQVGNPLNEGCLWDQATRLGVAGDWCNGSRVEGAFMSGFLLAEKLIESRIPSN